MNTQLLVHLHAANVGLEGYNDKAQKELLQRDVVHDPPEPPDVVSQGFASILLQSV